MSDPRHHRRMKLVQNLFAQIFNQEKENIPNPEEAEALEILSHKDQLDTMIAKYAPRYPLERVAKVDLAILRLAVYELIIAKKEPPKVVIDEAVTLAREFGGERSYAFINAVLGSIFREHIAPELESKSKESDE